LLEDIFHGDLDKGIENVSYGVVIRNQREVERFKSSDKDKGIIEGLDRLHTDSVIDFDEEEEDNVKVKVKVKKYSRSYRTSFTGERVSVTVINNNYFIGHYTSADLSILNDFRDFIKDLDIHDKSYVTLNKPILINGVNVYIRDTMALTPGGLI